jgi:hypothetical protein
MEAENEWKGSNMEPRILTEEVRRKLAGLAPFTPGATAPYTPQAYDRLPPEFRPVFQVRPCDRSTRLALADLYRAGKLTQEDLAPVIEQQPVAGWDTLVSLPSGELMPFGPGVLAMLPPKPFFQLHEYIMELTNGPMEIEKEGLPSAPPPALEPSSNPAPGADATPA